MIQPEILEYSNGMFTVQYVGNEYKFSNSFLKDKYPQYYLDDNIKQVYYKPGSDKNTIIYKDNTKEKLDTTSNIYQELIDTSNIISSEYKIKIYLEKSNLQRGQLQRVVSASPLDLFNTNVTEEEQDKLLKDIKEVSPQVVIDDSFFRSKLIALKTKVLGLTDWTQLSDVQASFTEEEKAAWLEYRAAVRNIDEVEDPKSVRLPMPPKDIEGVTY